MQLADRDLLRNVVFVGLSKDDNFQAVATGFIVGVRGAPGKFAPYLVTAQHVIAELYARGHRSVLWRANRKDGSSVVHSTDIAHWTFHPESGSSFVDVAVVPTGRVEIDFLAVDTSMFLTDERLAQEEVGPGDEIFVIGLFSKHYGNQANVPIVRAGHIAAMPGEPIRSKYGQEVAGYLVETRSIGGVSGSPVWFQHPDVRVRANQIQARAGDRTFLLGVMHGHFDEREHGTISELGMPLAINMGISIVTPAQRLLETLHHPRLVEQREKH